MTREERRLQERYGIVDRGDREPFLPRFNICPTLIAPIIGFFDEALDVRNLRWGLIPFGAKDERIGSTLMSRDRYDVQASAPSNYWGIGPMS